jgi:hypothetical protein
MGRAIAARLLDAGHDLTVWNRTPGQDEDLVSAGAARADTPAGAVRGAEVVITMLTDPPALEAGCSDPTGPRPRDRHAHRDVGGGSDRDRMAPNGSVVLDTVLGNVRRSRPASS